MNNHLTIDNLLKIIDKNRINDYPKWLQIAQVLFNVDSSLFEIFDNFSKYSDKYDTSECKKIWNNLVPTGYTINTLRELAEIDNPVEYNYLLGQYMHTLINDMHDYTHDDISKLAFELYKHKYRCTSIQKNIWYEFKDHRWINIDGGYTLLLKLSDEISKYFLLTATSFYEQSKTCAEAGDRYTSDVYIDKAKKILKISQKLKNVSFQNKIMSLCCYKFFDISKNFEHNLDNYTNLIGFTNGVFDLNHNYFRQGLSEDYISLNTNYDYKIFTIDSSEVLEVNNFFDQIMTNSESKLQLLLFLSSCLQGNYYQKYFDIWLGRSGSEGKSSVIYFMHQILGEYMTDLNMHSLDNILYSDGVYATPEIVQLKGKRLVCVNESLNSDDTISSDLIKKLLKIKNVYGRQLFQNKNTFIAQFNFVMPCNKLRFDKNQNYEDICGLTISPFESKFVIDPGNQKEFLIDQYIIEKLKINKQAFMWFLLNKYYPLFKINQAQ